MVKKRFIKENVDEKELLKFQQEKTEIEDKARETVDPVYADAIRRGIRANKLKEKTLKVEETPKREENPKLPKMRNGAKQMKLTLDESLFREFEEKCEDNLKESLVNDEIEEFFKLCKKLGVETFGDLQRLLTQEEDTSINGTEIEKLRAYAQKVNPRGLFLRNESCKKKDSKVEEKLTAEEATNHVFGDKGKITILGHNGYLGSDFYFKDGKIITYNFEIGPIVRNLKEFSRDDLLKHLKKLEKDGFEFVKSDDIKDTRKLHINNSYRVESLKTGLTEAYIDKSLKKENLSGTMTAEEIAKKHKVPVEEINKQVEKGIKVEKEHTDDEKKAERIALDHLFEIPDYYDRLDKMEKGAKKVNEELDGEELIDKFEDDGDIHEIVKAPNGRYFNHYSLQATNHYGVFKPSSIAGPYETEEEAREFMAKHRPKAKRVEKEVVNEEAEDKKVKFDYALIEFIEGGPSTDTPSEARLRKLKEEKRKFTDLDELGDLIFRADEDVKEFGEPGYDKLYVDFYGKADDGTDVKIHIYRADLGDGMKREDHLSNSDIPQIEEYLTKEYNKNK